MRFIVAFLTLFISLPAWAGEPLPIPPSVDDVPALKLFIEDSEAELDYVSRQYGVDMWVATKNEMAQVIYTTLDGRGMLMNGFLFAPDGTLVTEQDLADYVDGKGSVIQERAKEIRALSTPKTPGEKLWSDLGKSDYVEFGSKTAPVVYTFVDPYCPYCKIFWENITKPYVEEGRVNVRLIPVGILGENSKNAAAYIVSQSDRQQAWLDLVADKLNPALLTGDKGADVVAENYKIMGKWKMKSTPFSVYKGTDGKVKMYNGNPDDMANFLAEALEKAK